MTTISAADAALLPLDTDNDVVARVVELVGSALRRQVWLIFLDDSGVQLPLLIPIDGLPTWPDDGAAVFAEHVADSTRDTDVANVVIVWERPGKAAPRAEDRAWAAALAVAFARADLAVRGQLLAHDTGVRWLAPDDYL
ncbi:MAG TPA: hypothetical protein VG369_07330 [Humibacter sp.]|jgi:hypothetical protein|nr:hypothetical protein [Humibacter sp.]